VIHDLMEPGVAYVHADTDQERAASVAVHHGILSVPVLDDAGVLIGVVPPNAILDVLRREHVEDLHRLAGIRRESTRARLAMTEPPLRRVQDRLPWLLVGLLGSVAATLVVGRFEALLETQVAVAFFVPGIVYLADAIGTQTEAIVIRGISLCRASLRRLLISELGTGFLIGLVLAGLIFPTVALGYGDVRMAGAVSLSLIAASIVAATIGLLLPWILSRLGHDPAFGSGPIATVIQDIISLFVYFTIATSFVG
jgi:magnesium transporter